MWRYVQCTGALFDMDGIRVANGYSGASQGKNNPALEHEHNVGPIPCGTYIIGEPYDSKTHGPFVLPLTPMPANEMFGRSGFLIHGDSVKAPGTASQGCIILPRAIREKVAASGDSTMQVLSGLEVADVDGNISI